MAWYKKKSNVQRMFVAVVTSLTITNWVNGSFWDTLQHAFSQRVVGIQESAWVDLVKNWPVDEAYLAHHKKTLERTPVDTLSPLSGKNAMQYALTQENYQGALGIIAIGNYIKQPLVEYLDRLEKRTAPHDDTMPPKEDILLGLEYQTINPLAQSSSGRTTLEYAFLSLEKNQRPDYLARHLQSKNSTFNIIMDYLLTMLYALPLAHEQLEPGQSMTATLSNEEKELLQSIQNETQFLCASIAQPYTHHLVLIEKQLAFLETSKNKFLVTSATEKTPSAFDAYVTRLQQEQAMLNPLISKITEASHCIAHLHAPEGAILIHNIIASLADSPLHKVTKTNSILLYYWFTYFARVACRFAKLPEHQKGKQAPTPEHHNVEQKS